MKTLLRKDLLLQRSSISPERHLEATQKLHELLSQKLERFSRILSFASFGSEINLWSLNEHLVNAQKLYFPRVVNSKIEICSIRTLSADLKLSRFGIYEPIQKISPITSLEIIDCVLVPGLGFDALKQRIGYGKGHYDHLLMQMPNALKIGIGFKEQLLETPLPTEKHDIPMDELLLF